MEILEKQLRKHGIRDSRVLAAFSQVPREEFVDPSLRELAHADRPLSIGYGQTISQPYIVALTLEKMALRPDDRVLEIGTGSGYAAALLSRLCATVVTVERLPELAQSAQDRLAGLGYDNVIVVCADGTQGYEPAAPYDAIGVAAGGPEIPSALRSQLKIGGRLVLPVGGQEEQILVRVTRLGISNFHEERICKVRFVPLIGQQGWPEPIEGSEFSPPND